MSTAGDPAVWHQEFRAPLAAGAGCPEQVAQRLSWGPPSLIPSGAEPRGSRRHRAPTRQAYSNSKAPV